MLLFTGPLTYQWVRTRFSTSNWPETLPDPSTRISELQCSRNLVPSWVRCVGVWVCGCMCVFVCVWVHVWVCVCVCVCVATSPFVIMCMFTAGAVPRVMSLRNPEQKMSKSDPSELSRITLLDTPNQIKSKIAKAMTDSISSLSYDPAHRPGVSNLISLYGSVSGLDTSSVCAQFEGKQSVDLKNELGDLLVEELSPLRKKTMDLLENKEYVKDILSKGSVKAKEMASALLNEVKEILGIS